jgi:hypothetical protein
MSVLQTTWYKYFLSAFVRFFFVLRRITIQIMDPTPAPKEFVLCFDGTNNKFHDDESDSNVLKIFRVSTAGFVHRLGLT